MKSQLNRRTRRRRAMANTLETLEPRTLLTAALAGFSIPGLPSLPGGVTLPSFTNGLNLGALTTYFSPNEGDYWWLENTGQTLTNPSSGPATGTPGADINAYNAWNITQGTSNVVVAILDTGIDLENSMLADALWTNPGEIAGDDIDNDGNGFVDDIHGWNFLDNNNDLTDNFVHGTAVAATVLSVAPGISILPVQIGTAAGVNSQDIIDGINYLIALRQAGVNIVAINASYISFTPPSSGETAAIKSAGDNGMLYIAAAGNAGLNLDSMIPDVPSFLEKYIPSILPSNLIFVAATDNQDNLASFSDYGARTVAVGAPGVDITLPIPGGLYASLWGTSFAAPMVSGIAALLKSQFPTASKGDIKDAILKSGDLVPSLAGKTSTGRRVDAYKALNYMLGNQSPVGAVEVLDNTTISGWGFDPNLGSGAATIRITLNGTTIAEFPADTEREDLAATLGSANHGFSFDASTLPYGKHKIKVYVVDDPSAKLTLIGQGTLTINTDPTGALESADAKTITGWAFDSDVPTKPIQVKIYVDGKCTVTTTAKVARPDLDGTPQAGSHGFVAKLSLKPGIHKVEAYAVDPLTKALTLLGTTTVSSNRVATGAVEVIDSTTISGWAFDVDAGAKSIQVRYQIDDFAPVLITANLSRLDLQATLGSKNHGFVIALPQLAAGEHELVIQAVDANNKSLVVLASQTLVVTAPEGNPLPEGEVEFTSTQINGTVEEENGTGPIAVRIDIDNGKGTPFSFTTLAVDDPESDAYTFSFELPALTGLRRVNVYALDDLTGAPVLLASEMLNLIPPSATVESFTPAGAVGTAIAPSASNGQAYLRLDVDGLDGALVCAKLARPDQVVVYGRASVGYNIPMPQLTAGEHTATLYLIDPVTLTTTVLGELEFTTI